jgi:membrane fusion protein (multidrug efflux system)
VPDALFRSEALAHHARTDVEGHVLELSPRWMRWAYGVLLAVLATSLVYAAVGTVYEYASGPAVIRVQGRHDVTARFAGNVAEIFVEPGQRVHSGDLLVRLYRAQEEAERDRVEQEFQLQLVRVLRDPADQVARQALTSLRAQRELAEARLEERTLRAPADGAVSDVRIRPGQQLQPGDPILSLVAPDAPCVIVAMLPGHMRPQLKPGMSLRLELDGYRYAYRDVVVDAVGDEIIGPAELRRYLGPELADTIQVNGPTLLVRAHLPTSTFAANGQTYHYYDGMPARAEVRVRAESLLVTLVPGLKALFEGRHG